MEWLAGLLCVGARGRGIYIAAIECFTFHSTLDILTHQDFSLAALRVNSSTAPAFVNHSECVLPFLLLIENDLEQVFQMLTLT